MIRGDLQELLKLKMKEIRDLVASADVDYFDIEIHVREGRDNIYLEDSEDWTPSWESSSASC